MADKNIGSLPAASTVDDDSLLVAEQQGQAVKVTGAQFKGFAQRSVQQYVEQAQKAASDALEASEQALEAVSGIGTAVEDTQANKEAAQAAQAAAEQAQAGAEAAAQGAAEEVKEELQGLVQEAETAKTGAETAQSGAEAARSAIENMLVEAVTLATGQPATVSKSLVDEVVKLTFGLPAGPVGPKGETGDPGSSIDRIERTSGTGAAGTTDTYTIYLTDGQTSTFQVYNGADGIGSGDMLKSVYDPQGKNTDVFKYVDDKIADIDIPTPENIVTVPGGGQLEMSESLGSGPYTITFSEDEGGIDSLSASDVDYSNTTSGLEATDVQGAIDELAGRKVTGQQGQFLGFTAPNTVGAVDSPVMVVHITETESDDPDTYTYSADKTAEEIYVAYQKGTAVFAEFAGYMFSLRGIAEDGAQFAGVDNGANFVIVISGGDSPTVVLQIVDLNEFITPDIYWVQITETSEGVFSCDKRGDYIWNALRDGRQVIATISMLGSSSLYHANLSYVYAPEAPTPVYQFVFETVAEQDLVYALIQYEGENKTTTVVATVASFSANAISFNPSNASFEADNVQEAIEELKAYVDTSIGTAIEGSY